jgi:diaminohydroxyphosphoribosylaminopyrimidine deaminase/5-amino-6-(5-phosphoribosylamino)uracil reductase
MSASPLERADRRWMRAALKLAARGEGWTRPNPPVGAVVVKGDRIIGRGWHQKAGGPHAEVHALADAGEAARGATLYVTLEPCSTFGRTPPCTAAIQAAGVARVVAGTGDPNPKHGSRGFAVLNQDGIQTRCGVLEDDCRRLIAPFGKWIRTGMPYLTLKLAMTADGRIADATGLSRWITGPDARAEVHRLRRRADAILVGARTVEADDPGLLPEGAKPNPLYRVIIDGHGRSPAKARVFTDAQAGQTILCTTHDCPDSRRSRWESHGAAVWGVPSRKGHINLTEVLHLLGKMGLLHVVCEGGGVLAEGLVREGLVDEFWFFYAPRLLGGHAVPGFGGSGWSLAEAPALRFDSVAQAGDDLWVRAFPVREGDACSPA